MSNLNWCTYCDNAVNAFSDSLYCSEQCLKADALHNHPLLGYNYPEFINFLRPCTNKQQNDNFSTSMRSSSSSSCLHSHPSSANSSPQASPRPFLHLSPTRFVSILDSSDL